MFRFETLDIWKEAVDFVDKIYIASSRFPKDEMFALTSQLRRAAISVSANIAEGSASNSIKSFSQFLNYSIRSLAEVISELFIAKQRNYLKGVDFEELYLTAEVLIKRITCFKNNIKYHKP